MRIHAFLIVFMMCLSSYSSASPTELRPKFQHGEHVLSGYYKAPDAQKNTKGVVLFVSGDGDVPYDAHGYYDVIWKTFLDAGYAVFSWDKPGVGNSSGSWLNQSMQERQSEVFTAIDYVRANYARNGEQIGLIGFSQAGWVVPAVTRDNPHVNFMIGVGYAINWIDQSWYMTQKRLFDEGSSSKEVQRAKQAHSQEMLYWQSNPTYANYLQNPESGDNPVSEPRFNFIKKNINSDASHDYVGIRQPILILLGEQDLNVNTNNTYRFLNNIYQSKDNASIHMINNATHALLNHPEFSTREPGIGFLIKLMFYGENAYSKDFLSTLTQWLKQQPLASQ